MKREMNNSKLSIIIDGMEIRTKEQLLITMKEALSFPDYFGMNWDALDEVLKDLSWLEDIDSVEITFVNSNQILSADTDKNKSIFREIMNSAVEYWMANKGEMYFYVSFFM